jgi:protein-S-isoprenylcysteine O-methyltransferase Ste14
MQIMVSNRSLQYIEAVHLTTKLTATNMKTSYLVKHVLGSLIFLSILFISAGTINYWQGLIYLGIGMVMLLLNYTILRIDAGLSQERSRPGEGARSWDKQILALAFLSTITMYIVAGLDSGRYHWSRSFHWSVYVTGILLTMSGQLLFLIAQKQNRFFSSTVRIQTERNHAVCDQGLYSFVRHPAYLGSIVQLIGFPLLLGSSWSIIPVSISIVLFLIRTKLEDSTLRNELAGYREYSKKTRWKIIPGVW